MGTFIQRRKFDHPDFAYETANYFQTMGPHFGALVNATAVVQKIDGEYWVYVTVKGDLVEGHEMLLPDYEVVLISDS
ncbi:MAG TPA: hypothetical protein VFW35_08300 [Sphingomicrobium sp.]|nr:hypothetical protein [Sphingomicrobium sp.]